MITLTQKALTLDNDLLTPISLFMKKVGYSGSGILLESAEVGGRWGRYSLIAEGVLLKLSLKNGLLQVETNDPKLGSLTAYQGSPFFEGLKKVLSMLTVLPDPLVSSLPPITRGLYGYIGYEAVSLIEPSLAKMIDPCKAEAVFILPEKVFLFDHAYSKVFELSLSGIPLESLNNFQVKEETFAETKTIPAEEEYLENVRKAKALIGEGELIQLVLSVNFEEFYGRRPSLDLYRSLRRLNPSPYMFHLQLPEISLVVSSPEVLVSSDNNQLRLCPIAGTRPRGSSENEDNLFEVELVNNIKEQAEHVMLVDLGRNDLGKVAASGTVEVTRFMDVERFSHVMHLTSYIKASLEPGFDAVDVLKAAFPAGTVSGAPKIRAMELISQMENLPRGPYAGAIGWFGLDKGRVDLDFGITIRSAWIKEGIVHYRAGAGLVYDSDPYSEWRECLNKAKAIKEALEYIRSEERWNL
jgi:anthranilate synthase component 1